MSDEKDRSNEIGQCGNWTPFGPCQRPSKVAVPGLVREELAQEVPWTTAQARSEDAFRAAAVVRVGEEQP